jgi:hypothetical protein
MLFDLASLTKPLVTTPLALTYLDLDRDLSDLPVLSGFSQTGVALDGAPTAFAHGGFAAMASL